MNDPFGSMQNMITQFHQFRANPMQFLAQRRLNIPPEYTNNSNDAIQYLMNSGQLTQQQYNWANTMSQKILNNPIFNHFK